MNRRNLLERAMLASVGTASLFAHATATPAPLPVTLTAAQAAERLAHLRARARRVSPPDANVVAALARFPNPVLLYDLAQVEENYLTFLEAHPGLEVYYAVKCAPNARVLQRIAALGGGFDFASRGELDMALATGAPVAKCIYSNTVRRAEDIRYAHARGVRAFVADSEHEVRKLAANAPGSLLYLRISVDSSLAGHPLGDKFGTSPDEAMKLLRLGRELSLKPFGTHYHVGTQCMHPEAWEAPTRDAARVFRDLSADGIDLEFFDIGGGFPSAFASHPNPPPPSAILGTVSKVLAQELPGRKVRLAAEPGRGMVADAAVLSTRVMLRAERASGEWLHLDAGLYQGLFEVLDKYHYELSVPGRAGSGTPFTLCGPTCDSMDTISRGQKLPNDIDEDDMIIFHNAAAYSEACSTSFNGMAPPTVRYLDELIDL